MWSSSSTVALSSKRICPGGCLPNGSWTDGCDMLSLNFCCCPQKHPKTMLFCRMLRLNTHVAIGFALEKLVLGKLLDSSGINEWNKGHFKNMFRFHSHLQDGWSVCIRHLRAAMLLLLCTLVISFAIPFSECQIQNRMLPGVIVKQSNWEGFLDLSCIRCQFAGG